MLKCRLKACFKEPFPGSPYCPEHREIVKKREQDRMWERIAENKCYKCGEPRCVIGNFERHLCLRHWQKETSLKSRFNKGKKTAKKSWELSFDDYVSLFEKTSHKCNYCEIIIKDTVSYALDRKNPSQPYRKNNCVPCCWGCNRMKGSHLSYKHMLFLKPKLIELAKILTKEDREKALL